MNFDENEIPRKFKLEANIFKIQVKPRFFATALKLVHSLGLSIADEVKPSIAKHLLPLCDKILEAEQEQGKSLRYKF